MNHQKKVPFPKNSSSHGYGCCVTTTKTPGQFKDRKLFGINPLKQQFEPTDIEPIPQHKLMAGD